MNGKMYVCRGSLLSLVPTDLDQVCLVRGHGLQVLSGVGSHKLTQLAALAEGNGA